MERLKRPWKFTRRDTDSVQLEGIGNTSGAEPAGYGKSAEPAGYGKSAEPAGYGKNAEAQTKSSDSESNSQEVKAAEEDLRRFSVLHEFDPNLPCKYPHSFTLSVNP